MSLRKSSLVALLLMTSVAVSGCFKSSEERAAEHLERGLELVAANDLDRALVEFRNTLKYSDELHEVRRHIGAIMLEQGNLTGAYRNYLAFAERDADDVEARLVLSELAFKARNWDEFERHGARVLSLAPDLERSQAIDLGLKYREASQNDDLAQRDVLLAQATVISDEGSDNEIVRNILIDGLISQQKYEEALEQLDKAIATNPGSLPFYTARLELLAKLNDFDRLDAEFLKTVDVFPENEELRTSYLRFMVSRNEMGRAEDFLRKTVTDATDDEARTGSYVALVQFILQVRGAEAALVELDNSTFENISEDIRQLTQATIRFDLGQREQSIADLQALLEQETTTFTLSQLQNVKTTLARMLATDGNEVGARKLVEEVLLEDPRVAQALKMRAVWLMGEDDTDGAISALRTVLEDAPQDVQAMTLMAQAYRRAGNPDLEQNFLALAVEASNRASAESSRYAQVLIRDGKFLQAESVLIASLRLFPANIDVLRLLGQTYFGLKDFGRAQQVADTLEDLGTEEALAIAAGLKAELLLRREGGDEAIRYLQSIASGEGDSALRASLALVQAQLRSDNPQSALETIKTARAAHPDNLGVHFSLALTQASLRNFAEAEAETLEILEKQPDMDQAWLLLARIRSAVSGAEAAKDTIDEGLAKNPTSANLLWGKASYLQQNGDVEGAIGIYEQLYERESSSVIVANNLASLLATYRNDDESLARARTIARRLVGTDILAFQDTYGWILYRSGEVEEALEYLEPAAQGLARDYTVQFHLGMAYAASDQKEKALAQLRHAVELAGPLATKEPLVVEANAEIAALEAAIATQD